METPYVLQNAAGNYVTFAPCLSSDISDALTWNNGDRDENIRIFSDLYGRVDAIDVESRLWVEQQGEHKMHEWYFSMSEGLRHGAWMSKFVFSPSVD